MPVWVTLRAVTQAMPERRPLSMAISMARRATTMPKAWSPSSMAVESVSRRIWILGRGLRSPCPIMLR